MSFNLTQPVVRFNVRVGFAAPLALPHPGAGSKPSAADRAALLAAEGPASGL